MGVGIVDSLALEPDKFTIGIQQIVGIVYAVATL